MRRLQECRKSEENAKEEKIMNQWTNQMKQFFFLCEITI